jgi:hypothetical protein
MKNMSFSITTPQFRNDEKDVTRRWGWYDLKPGDRVMAVEKAMGIPKGEKMVRLGVIEIVSAQEEPLSYLTDKGRRVEGMQYGEAEVIREGFPRQSPEWLAALLADIKPKSLQRENPMRIEFRRVPHDQD